MYPTVSDNPVIQAAYEACRARGNSHGMAEIVAFRRAPGSKTNRELFLGCGTLAEQFQGPVQERVLHKLVANAEKLGRRPHYTDLYVPSLVPAGEAPGHPDAFVPASEGSSHIRHVCEKNDIECHGVVTVKR